MSLQTIPSFYYGFTVTQETSAIDFNEGADDLAVTIPTRSYTATELAIAIQEQLRSVGSLEYFVTFNRSTRRFTIEADEPFDLLFGTGQRVGNSIHPLIGFDDGDYLSSASWQGQGASGSSYVPQFLLQDYVDSLDEVRVVDASVNESTSGRIEVIQFGRVPYTEFNITYANDYPQPSGSPIRENLSGVSDLRDFIRFCVTKGRIEFNKNSSDPSSFETLVLESTEEDSRGVDYKLKELYSRNLIGYFESGLLRFRVFS